jgi:hypothetical protein
MSWHPSHGEVLTADFNQQIYNVASKQAKLHEKNPIFFVHVADLKQAFFAKMCGTTCSLIHKKLYDVRRYSAASSCNIFIKP